jgi:integrase
MISAWVLSVRDEMADSPSRANRFITVLRLLLKWGRPRGYRPKQGDPTEGIKRLRTGKGHRNWTPDEIALMTGPRAGEFALPVLLGRYTLQREEDIIRLAWTNYDGQFITLTQLKSMHTEEPVMLRIPVHPALKKALDKAKGAKSAVTICTRPDGKAWGLSHFKHSFTKKRRELEMPEDMHFHGLRRTGASALAEMGASDMQIMSFTGHKTNAMVRKYTKQAHQKATAASTIQLIAPPAKRGAAKRKKNTSV